MTAADLSGVPECVRCFRSEADHQAHASGGYDEVQRRIWRALGWPCAEFTETAALVFAANQTATSRWARRPRHPDPPATASAPPETAVTGAAAARAALDEVLNRRKAS